MSDTTTLSDLWPEPEDTASVSPSPSASATKPAPDPVTPTLSVGRFQATDSPCVAVCSTLFDDICRGCGRTAMEVSNWVFMDDEEKKAVWIRIKAQGYPRRP